MKLRVAFIDSSINSKYINNILKNGQTIGNVLTVTDNRVVSSLNISSDTLTHSTLCTKLFLDKINGGCELYFISILDDVTLKTNLNAFLIALSWCLENKINLINLSIGTVSLFDAPQLFTKVNELIKNGIIIVSAFSNSKKMTFPASFDNVIGVKALESKAGQTGYIYIEESIDRAKIHCYIKSEAIKYNDKFYSIYCSNSFATPIISAAVFNLLNEGCNSLYHIKNRLKTNSLSSKYNSSSFKKTYKEYFGEKIDVPVIVVVSDSKIIELNSYVSLFIQQIIQKFADYGYNGVCLSEYLKTNLQEKIINLPDFELFSVKEKLRFYSHYFDTAYIIINVGKEFLINNLKMKDIDTIIYNSKQNNLKHKRGIQYLELSEVHDIDGTFSSIYNHITN